MKKRELVPCSVPRCERVHTAKGYCSTHYEQFKRGITDPSEFKPLPAKPKCFISTCDRPQYCKGGCRTHYDMTLRFNLSLVQMNQIYDHPCGICGAPGDIHIDHDHSCCPGEKSCGECIRGGLCGSCNMAIGALGDSLRKLERALEYLGKGYRADVLN